MSSTVKSQEITEPSYQLEFLKATYEKLPRKSSYSNLTVLYFKYTKNLGDKTLVSMRFKYKLKEDDEEKIVNFQGSGHSITVFGTEHSKKKPHDLYEILKDKVQFHPESSDTEFIYAFYLRDFTPDYNPNMFFAYGLWEPADDNIRIEQYFPVMIKKL